MVCKHGGKAKSQSTTSSSGSTKMTTTFKSDGRFKVVMRAIPVGVTWRWMIVRVMDKHKSGQWRGFHNHKLEAFREGTSQRNQLTDEMKQLIRQMEGNQVPPRRLAC